MILNKKLGLYAQGNFVYVPHQHFMNKEIWKVLVNQTFPDQEIIKTFYFSVVATTPHEAACAARKYWIHYQEQQKIIEEIDAERAKKLRHTGSKSEPSLDQLQCKADNKVPTGPYIFTEPNPKPEKRRLRSKK